VLRLERDGFQNQKIECSLRELDSSGLAQEGLPFGFDRSLSHLLSKCKGRPFGELRT